MQWSERPAGRADFRREQKPAGLSIRRRCGQQVLHGVQRHAAVHKLSRPTGRHCKLFVGFVRQHGQFIIGPRIRQQFRFGPLYIPVFQLLTFAPGSAHSEYNDLLVSDRFRLAEAVDRFVSLKMVAMAAPAHSPPVPNTILPIGTKMSMNKARTKIEATEIVVTDHDLFVMKSAVANMMFRYVKRNTRD